MENKFCNLGRRKQLKKDTIEERNNEPLTQGLAPAGTSEHAKAILRADAFFVLLLLQIFYLHSR